MFVQATLFPDRYLSLYDVSMIPYLSFGRPFPFPFLCRSPLLPGLTSFCGLSGFWSVLSSSPPRCHKTSARFFSSPLLLGPTSCRFWALPRFVWLVLFSSWFESASLYLCFLLLVTTDGPKIPVGRYLFLFACVSLFFFLCLALVLLRISFSFHFPSSHDTYE